MEPKFLALIWDHSSTCPSQALARGSTQFANPNSIITSTHITISTYSESELTVNEILSSSRSVVPRGFESGGSVSFFRHGQDGWDGMPQIFWASLTLTCHVTQRVNASLSTTVNLNTVHAWWVAILIDCFSPVLDTTPLRANTHILYVISPFTKPDPPLPRTALCERWLSLTLLARWVNAWDGGWWSLLCV